MALKKLRIVKRKEWKACKPDSKELLDLPVSYVLLRYHTFRAKACEGDKVCSRRLRNLQEFHMVFYGFPDIQFNFLISSDGTVYKGRGWKVNPTKADHLYSEYKKKSIDIAYIGDFKKMDPTQEMVDARDMLIKLGIKKNYITPGFQLLEAREDGLVLAEKAFDVAMKDNAQPVQEEIKETPPSPPKPRIVRRPEWGARKARYQECMYTPTRAVILKYHTGTESCATFEDCTRVLRELQKRHKDVYDFADIAYNFLIGGDGTIYKGRGWTLNAERVKDTYKEWSGKCHEIAFIGDYRKRELPPDMSQALKDLIAYGIRKNFIQEDHKLIERRDKSYY